jgi:hypothetical protein
VLAALLQNKVQMWTETQISVKINSKKLCLCYLLDTMMDRYNITVNIQSRVRPTKYNFFSFTNVNNHFIFRSPQLKIKWLLTAIHCIESGRAMQLNSLTDSIDGCDDRSELVCEFLYQPSWDWIKITMFGFALGDHLSDLIISNWLERRYLYVRGVITGGWAFAVNVLIACTFDVKWWANGSTDRMSELSVASSLCLSEDARPDDCLVLDNGAARFPNGGSSSSQQDIQNRTSALICRSWHEQAATVRDDPGVNVECYHNSWTLHPRLTAVSTEEMIGWDHHRNCQNWTLSSGDKRCVWLDIPFSLWDQV